MGGEEELDREEAVDWDLRQQKGKDVGGEGGHGVLLEIEDEPETTVGKGGLAERESLEPLRPEMAQAEYPGDADGDVESSNGIIPEGETWVGVRAMQRAKRRQQETRDADIDVLYENQRGYIHQMLLPSYLK